MKTFLTLLATLLLLVIIIGGVVVFGPFRDLLPQGVRETVDRNIPDFFEANREAIVPIDTNLPDTGTPGASSGGAIGWSIPGQNGMVINVTPFMEGTSTTTTAGGSSTGGSSSGGSGVSPEPPEHDVTISGFTAGSPSPEIESSPYVITYIAQDKSFTISLFKEPIGETRKAAETELLSKLGISEAAACNLRYVVLTPWWVNSFYSGKNLGFSFCPGAPQF